MEIKLTGFDESNKSAICRAEDETLQDVVIRRDEFEPLFHELKIGDRLTVGASFDEEKCRIISIYSVNERSVTASGTIRKL